MTEKENPNHKLLSIEEMLQIAHRIASEPMDPEEP